MRVPARPRLRTPILLGASALALVAATCQTTIDPDGQPGSATLLPIGTIKADDLACRGGKGDCADWYRLQVQQQGDLVVLVESPVGAVQGGRDLSVTLADGSARQLEKRAVSPTEGEALITWQSSPGHYMVAVESRDDAGSPLPYELSLRLVLPPPPPPPPPEPKPVAPRFEKVRGEVLEIEGGFGEPEAVLIDKGERDGILAGQRGRLRNGDETIATIEVVDAYPEGSRARIEGAPSEPISAATRVEIDVPVEGGP